MLVCGILFLVGVGGCVGLASWFWHGLSESGVMPKVAPSEVLTGTPLAWRQLDTMLSFGPFPDKLLVGDFEGDGDDELLYVADDDLGTKLFEVSGASQQLSGYQRNRITQFISWDYDRNGVTELVRSDLTAAFEELQPVVMEVNTHTLGRLEKVTPKVEGMRTGDVDGDGYAELLSVAPDNPTLLALGKLGQNVWLCKLVPVISVVGDIDGDKRDEIILPDTQNFDTWWIDGVDEERHRLPAQAIQTPLCAADLDADGLAEVIGLARVDQPYAEGQPVYSQLAIWNPATTETSYTQRYEEPGGWAFYDDPWLAAVDIYADGRNELAWVPGGDEYGSELYIAKADGTLVYRERVGALVSAMRVAQAAGKQHLVLLTRRRLLVWP